MKAPKLSTVHGLLYTYSIIGWVTRLAVGLLWLESTDEWGALTDTAVKTDSPDGPGAGRVPLVPDDPHPLQVATAGTPTASHAQWGVPYTGPDTGVGYVMSRAYTLIIYKQISISYRSRGVQHPFYCGIKLIHEGQCSLITKDLLIHGDTISLIAYFTLYIFKTIRIIAACSRGNKFLSKVDPWTQEDGISLKQ